MRNNDRIQMLQLFNLKRRDVRFVTFTVTLDVIQTASACKYRTSSKFALFL